MICNEVEFLIKLFQRLLRKSKYRTSFLNPFVIFRNIHSIEFVWVARQLNSFIDQSSESWPLERLATHTARANETHKSAIDLKYAYANYTLAKKTKKPIGVPSGHSIFAFNTRFFGSKVLSNFFTHKMFIFSKT